MRLLRTGLRAKLFLAMLITSAVLIGAIMFSAHYSFHQGLIRYLNETESEQAQALAQSLAQYYANHGSWEALREDPKNWNRLLRGMRLHQAFGEDPAQASKGQAKGRIALLDANKNQLVGPSLPLHEARHYPIETDAIIVGWLLIAPSTKVTDALALQFKREQGRMFSLISLIALLLAGIESWLLARWLLGPIQELTRVTHALTAGQFTTRVQVETGDELQRLARDLNRLAETLEQTEAARRQWVADISHELRTPLAVMRGEIEAIEDGIRPLDTKALASLQSEVALLSKLVDDLYQLALSDVGALAYQKTEIDLISLLHEVCESYRARLQEAQLQLTVQLPKAPVIVFADPARLTQMFNNLFENSLRYTDPGGQLRLTGVVRTNEVILTLEDSAPGVSPESLPRLFDRLHREENSRSRQYGGAGLGLAICRSIAEGHGGTIQAQASELGGLQIQLTLPRETDR